jgi:hypothetical protein
MNIFKNIFKQIKTYTHEQKIEHVKHYMELQNIESYYINEDYSVDVFQNVFYKTMYETEHVKFNILHGNFDCSNSCLTSLKYCPKEIHGNFDCSNTLITTFDYFPENITGVINISKLRYLTNPESLLEYKFNINNVNINELNYYIYIIAHLSNEELARKNGDKLFEYAVANRKIIQILEIKRKLEL